MKFQIFAANISTNRRVTRYDGSNNASTLVTIKSNGNASVAFKKTSSMRPLTDAYDYHLEFVLMKNPTLTREDATLS